MQQPALELEQDGEFDLAALVPRSEAPMVFQCLERSLRLSIVSLDHVDAVCGRIECYLADVALAQGDEPVAQLDGPRGQPPDQARDELVVAAADVPLLVRAG